MTGDPFRKVRKPCSSPYDCGRMVITYAKVVAPKCVPCRHRLANLARGRELTMREAERRTRRFLRAA